jgi:hypothetical protein
VTPLVADGDITLEEGDKELLQPVFVTNLPPSLREVAARPPEGVSRKGPGISKQNRINSSQKSKRKPMQFSHCFV